MNIPIVYQNFLSWKVLNASRDIIGVLTIGIGAVLVLALIDTLLSSWLNATSRRPTFAVMCALGMASRQIATPPISFDTFSILLKNTIPSFGHSQPAQ